MKKFTAYFPGDFCTKTKFGIFLCCLAYSETQFGIFSFWTWQHWLFTLLAEQLAYVTSCVVLLAFVLYSRSKLCSRPDSL